MTPPCKWVTDEAGPLVCRKGQFGYSWSICASGTECHGPLSGPYEVAGDQGHRPRLEPSAAAMLLTGGR